MPSFVADAKSCFVTRLDSFPHKDPDIREGGYHHPTFLSDLVEAMMNRTNGLEDIRDVLDGSPSSSNLPILQAR